MLNREHGRIIRQVNGFDLRRDSCIAISARFSLVLFDLIGSLFVAPVKASDCCATISRVNLHQRLFHLHQNSKKRTAPQQLAGTWYNNVEEGTHRMLYDTVKKG